VCVCVYIYTHIHTHTYVYVYMYIYGFRSRVHPIFFRYKFLQTIVRLFAKKYVLSNSVFEP